MSFRETLIQYHQELLQTPNPADRIQKMVNMFDWISKKYSYTDHETYPKISAFILLKSREFQKNKIKKHKALVAAIKKAHKRVHDHLETQFLVLYGSRMTTPPPSLHESGSESPPLPEPLVVTKSGRVSKKRKI